MFIAPIRRKRKDLKRINLQKFNIEMMGILFEIENDYPWTLTILTKESIQKLQLGISKSLEVIGFPFSKRQEAILALDFLLENYFKNRMEKQ